MTKTVLARKAELKKKNDSGGQSAGNSLWHTVFWGLAALIFLPPFFRGLFFPPEQYKALVFASFVFWVVSFWKCKMESKSFFTTPLDLLVLGLPAVYLVSAFKAANTGLAVDEVVKNTLYFMVFWSVSRIVTVHDQAVRVLSVIYVAAVGLALAGLMTATGLVNIIDGFLNGRIYSSFQYPNALASYLIAALFIGLYLWQRDGSKSVSPASNFNLAPYLLTICNFLIVTVLVGTKSNGGFLVLVLTMFLFFLFLRGVDKIRILTHLASVGVISAATAFLFINNAVNKSYGKAWLIILSGAVLVLVLQYLIGRLTGANVWDILWGKKIVLVAAVAVIFLAGGLVAFKYVIANQDFVSQALAEIRLRNATERMYFYQDAMKMVAERPLLGWGGGGWYEAYRLYQGYLYNSNQVHSYYLQLLVEAGVAGLSVVIGIWGMILYMAHRLYHNILKDYTERLLVATVFTACLAVGGHALIDFDLSLSALTVALFAMFGVLAGLYVNKAGSNDKVSKSKQSQRIRGVISLATVTVFCLVTLFAAGSFSMAEGNRKDAAVALKKGNIKTATELMVVSTSNNPFKAEFNSGLAGLYAQQGKMDLAVEQMQKALGKAGYWPANHAQMAGYYLASGQYEKAVAQAEKAVSNGQYMIEWYEALSRTYLYSGLNLLYSGKNEEARKMLAKAVDVENMIFQQASRVGELEKKLWNVAPLLAPTPYVSLYSGAALCMTGKYPEAEEKLKKALAGEKTKAEGLLWLAVLSSKKGDNKASTEYLNQASALMPNAKSQFDMISKLNL